MRPMQYQSCGRYNPFLDRVLNESHVKCCEKCGFASTDTELFDKHLLEHTSPKFYCFYCNKVSFSESELHAHLKQHTSCYPYKCPHCGQGYIRRQFLMKHIERLHKNVNVLSSEPDIAKIPHLPVSSALPNVSTADSSQPQPAAVTVPLQRGPVVGLQNEPIVKTLNANVSHSTNEDLDHLSLVNVHTQHSRALTVSLPDEVTIPAGCTVELVEVKTVNGTKELKLRLVAKQEKSAITDSKNNLPQSTRLEKPLTSPLCPQTSAAKSMALGSSNRQQSDTQMLKVERHAAAPVSNLKNLPNQVNKGKNGHKRPLPYMIELDSPVLNKTQIKSIRERAGVALDALSVPAHLKETLSSVSFSRLNRTVHADKREINVCAPVRAEQEKKTFPPRPSLGIPLQSEHGAISRAWRKDPETVKFRKKTDLKVIEDNAELSQQTLKSPSLPLSLSVPSTSPSVHVRHPLCSLSKNSGVENHSISGHKALTQLLAKTPELSDTSIKKVSGWSPKIKSEEQTGGDDKRAPESFPVISSVFSLSNQQPNQPSLCGMVINKSCDVSSENHVESTNSIEKSLEAPKSTFLQISLKEEPSICKPFSTEGLVDHIKEEKKDTNFQQNNLLMDQNDFIKEEKLNTSQTDSDTKCFPSPPLSNTEADQESAPKTVEQVDASVCTDGLLHFVKYESSISSKFLTVSLKRVEVAAWDKSVDARNFMDTVTDCEAVYLMPLKVDQLVKKPGPNQPVVVLNHPKPRAPEQGPRADAVTATESSLVVPKCQILKMRLGKVMGQKYEVKGCTVRVLP